MENDSAQLPALLTHLRQVNNCNVAAATIMILDYFLALDLEVQLVWKSHWTLTKCLYLVSRYMPFFDVSVALYRQMGTSLSLSACKAAYLYTGVMLTLGLVYPDMIFTLRTWAVWEKDKRLTIGLPIFFLAKWVGSFLTIGLFMKYTIYDTSPVLGCIFLSDPVLLFTGYIILMAYDGTMLALMAIRGFSAFKFGATHLTRVVYGDGITYYIYIFTLSLLNVIAVSKLPKDYWTLLVMMERVFHATLACRVILHIRQQARRTTIMGTDIELYQTHATSLHFNAATTDEQARA